jgi:hypothetical protein
MLKINMNKLLEKEMDRKAFLRNAGIAVVVITGVSGVVKKLNMFTTETSSPQLGHQSTSANVYGGAAYGVPHKSA